VLTLYLALAEHGRGHTAQAKQLLKETTDFLDKPATWLDKPARDIPKVKNRDGLAWTERVQIDQLSRDQEAALKDTAP
jgi:hypothetical protein